MKVLSIFVKEFSYKPTINNLDSELIITEGPSFTDSILSFIHIELSDESFDLNSREKKLVNHIKWVSRKNNTKSIILHSFAHLAETKASIEFSSELLNRAETRLIKAGFEVAQTPFGYFLDLNISAPGYSLARIWANL